MFDQIPLFANHIHQRYKIIKEILLKPIEKMLAINLKLLLQTYITINLR